MTKYRIGDRPVPEWCAERITPYRKADGTTGYEFEGNKMVFQLNFGDILELKDSGHIIVRRGER